MTDTPLKKVFKEIIPMDIIILIVLLLITFIPELVIAISNWILGWMAFQNIALGFNLIDSKGELKWVIN